MKALAQYNEEIPEFFSWDGPASRGVEADQRFEFVPATGDYDGHGVQGAWRHLLEVCHSPEKLYQMPEFFQHLMETGTAGKVACDLHVVRRHKDARIVAIIPGRRTTQTIEFRLGRLVLFQRHIPVYQVLGSVPLLDASEEALPGFVFESLLEHHPDCRALLLQAMPEEMAATLGADGLSHYVLNGWRDCHTVPFPETVDAYLQKFSAKKRYNLSRQVRLLANKAGEVSLVRVERPDQVAALMASMRSFLSDEDHGSPRSQEKMENLARHGLLHCYMLQCGGETVALMQGTRSDKVWHVHNIQCKPEYMSLSAGASVVHLALQDAIAHFDFTHADFGYGTPNQEFRSTHVLRRRGKLLLCGKHGMTSLLFKLHGVQDRMNDALIAGVKRGHKHLRQRRQASR